MDAAAAITRDLAGIVGADHVLRGPVVGRGIDGIAPGWVVSPGSVEEVSRCLAVAAARDLGVAPTGQGTRLAWGNAPRRLDLVLALGRLNRILAYEPADLTVSVQGGVRLGALNAHAGPHRQFLPLDPARAAASTIGGLIATAASGPYRARYGTMRELLLGVTVVQGDGTVVKGGGRVVKNVTGYDMPKLHVGALGTLGVVVEAHLRLQPRPAAEVTSRVGFASAETALEAAVALRDTPLILSRLELLDRPTLVALGEPTPPPAALAVTIAGVPEAVRAQGECVVEVCRRLGGAPVPGPAGDDWWRAVSDVTWPPDSATSLALRIGTRPTDVVKAFRTVEASAASVAGNLRATAEVGNGVLHVLLANADARDAAALLTRVRDALAPLAGTCVVEHAPASVKASLDVWGDVGPALPFMRRLKVELDPRGLLNPGRYVGGI